MYKCSSSLKIISLSINFFLLDATINENPKKIKIKIKKDKAVALLSN